MNKKSFIAYLLISLRRYLSSQLHTLVKKSISQHWSHFIQTNLSWECQLPGKSPQNSLSTSNNFLLLSITMNRGDLVQINIPYVFN